MSGTQVARALCAALEGEHLGTQAQVAKLAAWLATRDGELGLRVRGALQRAGTPRLVELLVEAPRWSKHAEGLRAALAALRAPV